MSTTPEDMTIGKDSESTRNSSMMQPAMDAKASPQYEIKFPAPHKLGDAAPLGFSGFALSTFLMSLIQLHTNGLTQPNIAIGSAFAYGGLSTFVSGIYQITAGHTFAGTALASYGSFWIGTAIILTPGGFHIIEDLTEMGGPHAFAYSFGLYLISWFIFTFLLFLCSIRLNAPLVALFSSLALLYLTTGIGYLYPDEHGLPMTSLIRAGGAFGMVTAFSAWYLALVFLAESTGAFYLPTFSFPWSVENDYGRRTPREKMMDAA